jgi:hypothetical protein
LGGHNPLLYHCGDPFVLGWLTLDNDDQKQPTEESVPVVVGRDPMDPNPNPNATILLALEKQDKITRAIEYCACDLVLKLQWQEGDFVIIDNLGLAHFT